MHHMLFIGGGLGWYATRHCVSLLRSPNRWRELFFCTEIVKMREVKHVIILPGGGEWRVAGGIKRGGAKAVPTRTRIKSWQSLVF